MLGAIEQQSTVDRVEAGQAAGGTVLRDGGLIDNEQFPEARTLLAAIIAVDESDDGLYQQECFGPIIYLVKTADTARSIEARLVGQAMVR